MRSSHRIMRCIVVLCFAAIIIAPRSAHAGINTWTSHGPEGGAVQALAVDPSVPGTIYAGAFKSTDGGDTWTTTAFSEATGGYVTALAIDPTTPSTIYAGSRSIVLKSVDGGATWSAPSRGLPSKFLLDVEAIVIDPSAANTLYAGGAGVFKSSDAGDNWVVLTDFDIECSGGIGALVIDPTAPGTVYASVLRPKEDFQSGCGVYKTTDGGETWGVTGLFDGYVRALAIDPSTPSTLYATVEGDGIMKSTNGGDSWTAINSGLPDCFGSNFFSAIAVDPFESRTLYASTFEFYRGCPSGTFRSMDGGATWSAFNDGLSNSNVVALATDPTTPGRLYAGTDYSISNPQDFPGGVFTIQQVDPCAGDCDGDLSGTVDELMTGINIALEHAELTACPRFDDNGNQHIEINELIAGVNHLLRASCEDAPETLSD